VRVIDWIANDAAEDKPEAPIGGLGGWFGFNPKTGEGVTHTWADYIATWKEPAWPYAEALRDAIVAGRIWECGDWHQADVLSDGRGVPLFEDGTVATFSFRAWGDLMAAVWSEQLGRQYCYMDFYYATPPAKPADFEARASMGVKRATQEGSAP
jgi:hypothetical protein